MCKVKKPKEFSGFCMNSETVNGRLMGKAAAVVCRQQPLSQSLGVLKPALATDSLVPRMPTPDNGYRAQKRGRGAFRSPHCEKGPPEGGKCLLRREEDLQRDALIA